MTERYIVEFGGQAYGLLVRDEDRLIFHATHDKVFHLDGRAFDTVGLALSTVNSAARGRAA
jgi:hypothetical protein